MSGSSPALATVGLEIVEEWPEVAAIVARWAAEDCSLESRWLRLH